MERKRRSWLRVVIWTLVGCLTLLTAAYFYATRPARLRAQVVRALAKLPVDRADVASVSYSPWRGVELVGLTLASGPNDQSENEQPPVGGRILLSVDRAQIRCSMRALLTGRLRPRHVALRGVELKLVCADDGRECTATQTVAGSRLWQTSALDNADLPPIELHQADIQLLADDGSDTRLVRRWQISGRGAPTTTGYGLRIRQAGAKTKPLLELDWNRRRGDLATAVDWLDVDTASLLFRRTLAPLRRDFGLRGRIRVDRALFTAQPDQSTVGSGLRQAELRLSEVHCAIPIEDPSADGEAFPVAQRFLQLRDADVAVQVDRSAERGGGLLEVRGHGRLNGAPTDFSVSAQAADAGAGFSWSSDIISANLRVTGMEFPDPTRHAAFTSSRRLPGAARALLRKHNPRGQFNLSLRAARKPTTQDGARLAVVGEIEAVGAQYRYYHFPYDFNDVHGTVRFSDEGIYLDGVSGRHGSCLARADGIVNNSRSNSGFDLVFTGQNIPLDADLYAALPQRYQSLWQHAAPLGMCDAVVTLARDDGPADGSSLPTDTRVDARMLGGSVLIDSRERLHEATGAFSIAHGEINVHDLRGHIDGADASITGTVATNGTDAPTNLRITAADIPIQFNEMPDAGVRIAGNGRADVWGQLSGGGLTGKRDSRYVVHLKDGVVTCADADQPWQECSGWIRVADDRREIVSFRARQGPAVLDVAGTLPKDDEPAALSLKVDNAPMERVVPQIVPRSWSRAADALGLAGSGTIDVCMLPEHQTDASASQAADVRFTAERMKPAPLPLDLRDANVHTKITSGSVDVRNASAAHGSAGRIAGSGRFDWTDETARGEFHLSAQQLELSAELIDALPAPAARLLRRLTPKGHVNLELERVEITGDEQRTWDFTGRLTVEGGELDLGLPLTEFDGALDGEGVVHPDGEVELATTLSITRGKIAGRPIADWHGELKHERDDTWVHLTELRGRLCDGDALGNVRIDPNTSAYEVSLTLQNARFSELMPPKEPAKGASRGGRADGHLHLRGIAGDAASRTGTGDLRIRGTSFLRTPVLAEVAEASRQAHADMSDAVDSAELRFMWRGSVLDLTRVDIQSKDLRLVGKGSWDMDSDALEMTLLGAHPRHWPRVVVLTDVLEKAGQELLQYHVHGTASKPQVTVEPLHRLNDALRALLSGDRGEE